MTKVLVVATSRKTRGGITSVIKAHEEGKQWEYYHCRWIETHIDGSVFQKILYFVRGLLQYLWLLPHTDLVHIHLAAVERKMSFILLAKLFRKKIIVHLHFPDPQTTLYNKSKAWKYRWCMKQADKIIALSYSWKTLIENTLGIIGIEVVYNPCPKVNRQIGDKKSKYILYAGNLSIRKGYSDLLKAFAMVADVLNGWNLVFAGNGEIQQAKELALKLGISNRCSFLGWVNGKEKEKAFQQASAYCLPSYAEGFPMGVLDAWAYGLPVLTTPVGGLTEILKTGENALVFTPGDLDGLSNCLKAIGDDNMRHQLSAASLNLADTKFNIENINNQLSSIYKNLLDK